jgi:hypothetical protein
MNEPVDSNRGNGTSEAEVKPSTTSLSPKRKPIAKQEQSMAAAMATIPKMKWRKRYADSGNS